MSNAPNVERFSSVWYFSVYFLVMRKMHLCRASPAVLVFRNRRHEGNETAGTRDGRGGTSAARASRVGGDERRVRPDARRWSDPERGGTLPGIGARPARRVATGCVVFRRCFPAGTAPSERFAPVVGVTAALTRPARRPATSWNSLLPARYPRDFRDFRTPSDRPPHTRPPHPRPAQAPPGGFAFHEGPGFTPATGAPPPYARGPPVNPGETPNASQPFAAPPSTGGYQRWTPGSGAAASAAAAPRPAAHSCAPPPGSSMPARAPHPGGSYPPADSYPRGAPHPPSIVPPHQHHQHHTPATRPPSGSLAGATTSAPSTTPGPSYDVVHLSARNARLEEKLSKALAKNRSMAKYYDQLLAKTRDAQEREMETLTAENRRLVAEAARGGASAEELDRARAERDSTRRELEDARARLDARDGQRGEESAATAAALRVATDQLAARDEEVATLRAALRDARASPLAESTGAVLNVSHGGNTQTLSQMQRMLDQAREERERERKQAAARDKEMARQLNDIKEQALDRIKETTAAAKEVAALKERARAAEAERDRLRDVRDELEADDHERRELRRRFAEARDDARVAKEKAERCDLAEAKLRASEANVATLQEERAEAHRRLQEMTERLLAMSNEKDVLVRHSAHQVHVEAELAVARREVERLGKTTLAARAKASESGAEWREGAESLGRVLRAHIYGHARWEREVAEVTIAASEAHALGHRSAVRLVAAAERGRRRSREAIEVIRTTRQLLREYGAEAAVMEEVARAHERRADERVEAALSMLREAERRATTAERDAASAAGAERARTAAARAGALPSSLVGPTSRPKGTEGTERTIEGMAGTVDGSSLASDGRRGVPRREVSALRRRDVAPRDEGEEASDAALLRSQLALARRETGGRGGG